MTHPGWGLGTAHSTLSLSNGCKSVAKSFRRSELLSSSQVVTPMGKPAVADVRPSDVHVGSSQTKQGGHLPYTSSSTPCAHSPSLQSLHCKGEVDLSLPQGGCHKDAPLISVLWNHCSLGDGITNQVGDITQCVSV